MVPGVGDHEAAVVDEQAGGEPQPVRRPPARGLGTFGGEVGLAEHHVGRCVRVEPGGVVPRMRMRWLPVSAAIRWRSSSHTARGP